MGGPLEHQLSAQPRIALCEGAEQVGAEGHVAAWDDRVP